MSSKTGLIPSWLPNCKFEDFASLNPNDNRHVLAQRCLFDTDDQNTIFASIGPRLHIKMDCT